MMEFNPFEQAQYIAKKELDTDGHVSQKIILGFDGHLTAIFPWDSEEGGPFAIAIMERLLKHLKADCYLVFGTTRVRRTQHEQQEAQDALVLWYADTSDVKQVEMYGIDRDANGSASIGQQIAVHSQPKGTSILDLFDSVVFNSQSEATQLALDKDAQELSSLIKAQVQAFKEQPEHTGRLH